MLSLICLLLNLFTLAIIVRAILSWFPLSPDGIMFRVASVLNTVTEPVLGPVRRVMPRVGVFDLSPLVVLLACFLLQAAIGCGPGLI
ncbi:MAG TPA: YggT family protein [Acidimicrobiales bacterium]|jgi:YggT family protein|nr:YggT family protein [Acidimicrobiales bacterium]